ncbi:hypothetical protein H6G20_16530 [Desertifilum sp. FACHB-1129]|uniref:Uncharacterized protein n=2 Tax=Cyanophyceae TaxID=3028117 RepID=A0A1E5QLN6_9CYAN|nr:MULTISPECIES: hypothetical protein [Cyanophyceae]MDA0212000.1 hypothetical protein [Cyanobacteria bacterium FC1]MDI9638138.1 hypothetical protein [Geitlerinema splendidum]MDK3157253.1 hypothetical protein [Kamptonema cortianum]MDL5051264.1 hypothetical protein [Oscillatoria amoena NRMC-F 0135]MBD2313274.1 hypothetical protein [Desertifilum sp. FACHB-1129]
MSQLTLNPTNGKSAIAPPEHWLKQSVGDFFAGINWERHSVEVQQIKRAVQQGSREPLALTLKVSQFLSCIPWEGQPLAASPVAEPEIDLDTAVPPSNEFTLEDFSDLF